MISVFARKRASSLALAIALSTGTALVATAIVPTDASAQRKRDRDRNTQESDGGGYSNEFREAYVPLDEALKAEGADVASLKPQLLALVPLLNTNDEKIAGGGLIFNAGIAASDRQLQLQGMELMLSSGKVPAEQNARYNFIAYQLANEAGDYAKARTYLQAAIDGNFTTDTVNPSAMRIAMAESYFAENRTDEGLDYLADAIQTRLSSGQSVDEQWYRRGVTVAYEQKKVPQVYDFAVMWIGEYPSEENWRDAINLTRNLNEFQAAEILDLFRLSRTLGTLTEPTDYDYYVEAADARRLPLEVKELIEEGYASGNVSRDNLFITEAYETASGRIAADRAELPAIERDAMASGAQLRTVVAAANTFLSYGDDAKAVRFFEKALGMPGVDASEANLRLGIAQARLGNYDAARAALAKVQGNRMPIAKLWVAYVNQVDGGNTVAEAAASAASAAPEMTGN